MLNQRWFNVSCLLGGGGRGPYLCSKTRDVHPMLGQCWASVADDGPTFGPTLTHYWVNVSHFLGHLARIGAGGIYG